MNPELIIYLPETPEASRTCRALDRIVGKPVIRYVADRLGRGFPGTPPTVVYHDDGMAASVEAAFGGANAGLWKASVHGFFAALNEYHAGTRSADVFAIFMPDSPFPDCTRAKDIMDAHGRARVACTIASNSPLGLVPLILETAILPCLLEFDSRLRDGMHPLTSVAIDLLMQERSGAALPGMPIQYVRDEGRTGESLPEHVTIFDRFTRAAAETAAAQIGEGSLDSSAASRFKTALAIGGARSWEGRRTVSLPAGERPRVLFCSTRNSYAGAEESLLTSLAGLKSVGKYRPVLLVQGECLLAEKARSAGIPVEVADFDLADVGPLALNYSFDCLRRNNPAVVHLDTMLAPALMIAAYIQRIPIVGHVRCVVAPEMRIPQLVHFLDCAITVSDCVDKSLRRTSFDERRIVRIYDAIDLRDYDPAQYNRQELRQSAGLPEDAFVVSMLARIHPDKRQETLLRALGDLKPDHPDIYVVIAGHTHHREYLDRLRRLVDEMGLQERVLFWGFEPEPARVYAISDLVALCMPAEGWGRCTAEAMAMGVPVIAPDAGGSTELVSHGEDGLLYSAGDSSELAASIAALRLDPAMRARLRHAARVKAASYSVERHVSAVEAVYAGLLGLTAEAASSERVETVAHA